MVTTCMHTLATGITLECRTSGQPGKPLLLFLHGFPEGAFIWDELLEHFGAHYRCVAPNLRGYGRSSQPNAISDYRAKYLVDDLAALIALESPEKQAACVIAHDWGGALAWGFANRFPKQLQRLLILNAPHPGSFLRELQKNPAQQAASQYMHFLRRPDAPALLAENHWQRLLAFFQNPDGNLPAWLTPARQQQYRDHWNLGMHGACMYYAASPLVPPHPNSSADDLHDVRGLNLPDEMLHIRVPVHILWGDSDIALQPTLLMGLEQWIAQLKVEHLKGTGHWVVHEQPEAVLRALTAFLKQ
ncbi:alpha/beta fold hydrolase [Comamonas sp. Y33R10-2]|uniref:alpha/beta fold hydrolase n=1 Tax=Comamonas sp. Y33R10-2 TaxID=2853257 RepID=UPI001C5CA216|nr:alpha/beta fold hydrolase [Comamonas sp. Y33R10-2]QXZ09852.1 alpha/beta fold hydrolase [Comamonas sp. Y33R10-2]